MLICCCLLGVSLAILSVVNQCYGIHNLGGRLAMIQNISVHLHRQRGVMSVSRPNQ